MINISYTVDDNGCHNLCGRHIDRDGYSQIKINGKLIRVHRYIYSKNYGEIDSGLIIRHKCDNSSCINPDHLIIGTHEDNVRDRVKRGRSAIGENNGRSKLKEDDVKAILLSPSKTNTELAKLYNVSAKLIRLIRKREIWKGVTI